MKRVEILSPAGNLEKLKYAIEYGADAVYCGIPDFSLRVRINKFDEKTLREAVRHVHERKKKIYITLNIYAHNRHLSKVEKHLRFLKNLDIDGVIISDPGIINLAKKYLPKIDIHLSTQANATNWQAVKFWGNQGIKRVILAREVTLSEIKEIRKQNPKIELEYFVHGAMCMSYSGRCILSKWVSDRSANLGDCTQPCRWSYHSKNQKLKIKNENLSRPLHDYLYTSLKEDKNGFEVDLEEDKQGTYFFNSYDLNLIEHVKDLMDAGIDCLKIEGRAKSAYYVAIVTRAYRKVVDAIGSKNYKKVVLEQKKELNSLANRGYTTGFLLGKEPKHNFLGEDFGNKFQFVGEIVGGKDKMNAVKVHNSLHLMDTVEAISPDKNILIKIKSIFDDKIRRIKKAHGGHEKLYYFIFNRILPWNYLIRKKLK